MNTETEATIATLRQDIDALAARVAALEALKEVDADKLGKAIALGLKLHQRSQGLDAVGKSGPEMINLPRQADQR